ncbi:FadR/GntR family transcriptional regulator [uncultured Propionivibrio sp.]|uniref:FadR/GntR family transcriptional regulator n=1 Tax=uncultured Propionivibrio sp. TaxID=426737 RepID=UPI0029C04E38|nr:FadR/GntR family transcriptional regulator [uncultured Propionivibrio sp.]
MNNEKTAVQPRRRPVSLAQEVMNDLAERIRSGRYRPGDKLPTEPELMVEQGVSRTVVREAMSRLQAAGLVETRHGVGTFARAPSAPKLDLTTVVTIRDVLAMLELRISLETEAAGLAAQRRTEEQLGLMREALAAFEQGVRNGERSIEADFQFHLQIALATHNKYFEEFYRHLGPTTIPRTRIDISKLSLEPGQDYLLRTNREHEAILDAIYRQDPQAASAAMRMHLTNSRERLKRASENSAPVDLPIQN